MDTPCIPLCRDFPLSLTRAHDEFQQAVCATVRIRQRGAQAVPDFRAIPGSFQSADGRRRGTFAVK
jgi:hypothetical protein